MFNLFRKQPKEREAFEAFLMTSPHGLLEEVLDRYIKKYSLRVSHSLEEPTIITDKRTKLKILEESIFADPALCESQGVQAYIQKLRGLVSMFDTLSPDTLAAMKAKEKKS